MENRPSPHAFPTFHPHVSLQDVGFLSLQSSVDAFQQFGIQADDSATSFQTSSASSSVGRRDSGGGDVDFSSLAGSDGFRSLVDRERFTNSWYGKKEDAWEDEEGDVFYGRTSGSEDAGSYRDKSDYSGYGRLGCQADGSGEDQPPLGDAEAESWLNGPPSNHDVDGGDVRWRGETDHLVFASACQPMSRSGDAYPQKLDSFSDAFLSHRKTPYPGGDMLGHMWDAGAGTRESPGLARRSCAFDSFPSPPTASHLVSSVLSPPPTPLPAAPLSPSKMESPAVMDRTTHLFPQEAVGTLQFFPSRLPSVHPSGVMWKPQLLSSCLPLSSSGDPHGNPNRPLGGDCSNVIVQRKILQPADSSCSISHHAPLHPLRAPCPSKKESLHASSIHPAVGASRPTGRHTEAVENSLKLKLNSAPCGLSVLAKNGPAGLRPTLLQKQATAVYTGRPFPSILHSGRGHQRGRHTPLPLLNPLRRGPGLYSSVHAREEPSLSGEQAEEHVRPRINVGRDFQAEVPPCRPEAQGPKRGSGREQLLWKPRDELGASPSSQDQVEKLLMMCSSSCLPGGGSNTELALHCLHRCKGSVMLALQMLLFERPSPAAGFHYSGSDVWTKCETGAFHAALAAHGKDFSSIQKKVGTKTVRQCVEFYYLSKKLQDKQRKHEEEEEVKERQLELQKNVPSLSRPLNVQFGLQETVSVTPLASFFPCKLCGKMFYKIKSRNAHMKIHRQPQDDWPDRRLQQQLLSQRLALGLPSKHVPAPAAGVPAPQTLPPIFSPSGPELPSGNKVDNAGDVVLSSVYATTDGFRAHGSSGAQEHGVGNVDARSDCHAIPVETSNSGLNQRRSNHQSWSLFGHNHFYAEPEVKECVGAETGRDAINWQ